MVKIVSYDDINPEQWSKLIQQSTVASFFQTKSCYDFYVTLSFLEPFVWGISEDGELKGLVCGYMIAESGKLKSFFSRRAVIPGGALLDADISDNALETLLLYTISWLKKRVLFIEIRNYNDYSKYRAVFEKCGFSYRQHLNIQIDLTKNDPVLKTFSKTKQRQIRIAENNGVTFQETENRDDIRQFYSILKTLYQTKIKHPLFPVEFFEKLVQTTFGKLFVVKHAGNVIGGIACVILPDKIVYEWFVCGDDKANKQYYPSLMATWAGIKYAVDNECDRFDFMGAGSPEKNYGVREFKSKFGGDLVEHGRFIYICKPVRFNIGKVGYKLLQVL